MELSSTPWILKGSICNLPSEMTYPKNTTDGMRDIKFDTFYGECDETDLSFYVCFFFKLVLYKYNTTSLFGWNA